MSHSCCRSVTLTSAFSFLLFTSSYTWNISSSQVFLWSQPAFEPQHRTPTLSARGLASVTDLGLVCQSVIKEDSTPQQLTVCLSHSDWPKDLPLTASSWPLASNMQLDHKLFWLSQTSERCCESYCRFCFHSGVWRGPAHKADLQSVSPSAAPPCGQTLNQFFTKCD